MFFIHEKLQTERSFLLVATLVVVVKALWHEKYGCEIQSCLEHKGQNSVHTA